MRAKVLMVQWHEGRAPIYSVHISKKNNLLATGGQDQKVLLWKLAGGQVEHVATLDEHVATVNCVRWDPQGNMLASATDGGDNYGGQLLIWAQEPITQVWRAVTRCQVQRDIYDISWSPDGSKVAAVGTDTSIRIYDAQSGKEIDQFSPHSHYIQGIAWDPLDEVLVSQSMDRTLAVHTFSPKGTRKYRDMVVEGVGALSFLDEKASSYFRRLAFTPDGSILIAPTACLSTESESGEATQTKCTLLFTRKALSIGTPSAALPLTTHASVAIACSPLRYKHAGEKLVECDYACIYAVVTQFLVLVYSTQAREPLCVVGDLHPTAFTDLAWSNDGKSIILSSMEGFCSLIEFEDGDLPPVDTSHAEPVATSRVEQTTAAPPAGTPSVVNMLTARRKPKKTEATAQNSIAGPNPPSVVPTPSD